MALLQSDFPDSDLFAQPAHLAKSDLSEGEALAGNELADDIGDEDLSPSGLVRDSRGGNDRGPEQVVVLSDGLASIDAGAYTQRLSRDAPGHVTLEGQGAIDCLLRRGEAAQETVTHGFDFAAAVGREGGARDASCSRRTARRLASPSRDIIDE